jgi:fibronectin-binding autotransporter adhesin
MAASISGSGGITRSGGLSLAWTISGNNSYTGLTQLISASSNTVITHSNALGSTLGGTLVTSASAALAIDGSGGSINVGAESLSITGAGTAANPAPLYNIAGNNSWGGLITLTGQSTIGAGGGTLSLNGGITATNQNLAFNGAGHIVVNGHITNGTGTLSHSGAGTLTLNGASTNTATFTQNAGTVYVNNTAGSGTGNGNVTVNGGTLAGSGRVGGAVTVSAAGTIAPGVDGVGTLTTGQLNIVGAGKLAIDINSNTDTADQLIITAGGVLLGSSAVLDVVNLGNQKGSYGESFVIVRNDSSVATTGNFAGLPTSGSVFDSGTGLVYSINYAFNASNSDGLANDIQITFSSVPEPAGLGFIALGGAALLRRRRRAASC